MSLIITVPPKITTYNIGKTFNQVADKNLEEYENYDCTIDLSYLQFVDPQGLSYIALLPFYVKYILDSEVLVILPKSNDLISYLEFTGILQIYFNEFKIYGYNIIEDVMFLLTKYRKSNNQKARAGVIKKGDMPKFLRNEFVNIENLLSNQQDKDSLCLSFYEIVNNIFDHSENTIGSFSFHFRNNCELIISIADVGIGIKKSLQKSFWEDTDTNKKNDVVYITEAIKNGVTCTNQSNRGLGLYKVVNCMEDIKISSGFGQLRLKNGNVKESRVTKMATIGTNVYIKIRIYQRWI